MARSLLEIFTKDDILKVEEDWRRIAQKNPIEQTLWKNFPKEDMRMPDREKVNKQYAVHERIYRYLFGKILLAKTGIGRLDCRIAERKYVIMPEELQDVYQRSDMTEMSYFYIAAPARVERLTDSDLEQLEQFAESEGMGVLPVLELVNSTYRQVMIPDSDHPDRILEIVPTIRGEYNTSGDSLIIGLKSFPTINEQGAFEPEMERKRVQVMFNIKRQSEPILSKAMGMKVVIFL